jgi:hypothetical protein
LRKEKADAEALEADTAACAAGASASAAAAQAVHPIRRQIGFEVKQPLTQAKPSQSQSPGTASADVKGWGGLKSEAVSDPSRKPKPAPEYATSRSGKSKGAPHSLSLTLLF